MKVYYPKMIHFNGSQQSKRRIHYNIFTVDTVYTLYGYDIYFIFFIIYNYFVYIVYYITTTYLFNLDTDIFEPLRVLGEGSFFVAP